VGDMLSIIIIWSISGLPSPCNSFLKGTAA
jgi:hypothetical protein